MAFRDWNGDGQKNMVDDYFEYNIYKECTKGSGNGGSGYSGSSSSAEGCGTCLGYIIAIVIVYFFVSLFIPDEEPCMKIGCDRDRTEGSSYCYFHEHDYY